MLIKGTVAVLSVRLCIEVKKTGDEKNQLTVKLPTELSHVNFEVTVTDLVPCHFTCLDFRYTLVK